MSDEMMQSNSGEDLCMDCN